MRLRTMHTGKNHVNNELNHPKNHDFFNQYYKTNFDLQKWVKGAMNHNQA